jgi:hypothetical protein
MITCEQCGRAWPLVDVWPIHCTCRNRVGLDRVAENKPIVRTPREVRRAVKLPCIHRGAPIRKLDCGCEGNSILYRCELRGECLLRPLPASTFRGATCDACDVRQAE